MANEDGVMELVRWGSKNETPRDFVAAAQQGRSDSVSGITDISTAVH